jgi:hypothetical protein
MRKQCLALGLVVLLLPTWLFSAPAEWEARSVSYALCVGSNGSTVSSVTAPGSDIAFTLACTTTPKDHKANTVMDACALMTVTTGTTAPQAIVKLKSGSAGTTTLVSNAAFLPANSSVTNGWICFKAVLTAAPGAAVPIYTSFVTYPSATADARDSNATAQPVNLATNGNLVWTVTWQWGSAGTGTNTAKLEAFVLQVSN